MGEPSQLFSNHTDPVTGLPSRAGFLTQAGPAVAQAASGALCIVDIDGMRGVNSALGRTGGDAVIAAVAGALRQTVGERALVGRDSGDGFAVLVPDAEPLFANMAAEDILKKASAAGVAAGAPQLTVSVGIASIPDDGTEIETLLVAARAACRGAREAGGSRVMTVSMLGPPTGTELLLDRLPCPEFIGRQKEFDSFTHHLEMCGQDIGYLFIRGEAGCGKSRFLREVVRIARSERIPCAYARCGPIDVGRPYAALVRAIADYADATLDSREVLIRNRSSDEIEELIPLFRRYGVPIWADSGEAHFNDDASVRRNVTFGALVNMLREAARQTPIVLALDSVTHLDQATLQLLAASSEQKLVSALVCGVVNDRAIKDESGNLFPAAAVCERRGSDSNVWELRLGRLSPAECDSMNASILVGRTPGQDFDRALYGISTGNPMHHESLLRIAAMKRSVKGSGGDWVVMPPPGGYPRTLDTVMDATLQTLPADLREAIAAVAAGGDPVGVGALAYALGCSEGEASGYADELRRLKLIMPEIPGSDSYIVVSDRLAERAIEQAGEDFLEVVHAAFADRAARLREAGLSSASDEAYHRHLTMDKDAASAAGAAAAEECLALWVGTAPSQPAPVEQEPPAFNRPGLSVDPIPVNDLGAVSALVDALNAAIDKARVDSSADVIEMAETRGVFEGAREATRSIGLLSISVSEDSIVFNGAPIAEAPGLVRLAQTLRLSGISSITVSSETRIDEYATVIEAIGRTLPDNWEHYLDARHVDRIGIVPGTVGQRSARSSTRRSPSTRRIARFEDDESTVNIVVPRELLEPIGDTLPDVPSPQPAPPDDGEAFDDDATHPMPAVAPGPHSSRVPPAEPAEPTESETESGANQRVELDALGPEKILQVKGIPAGGDPIRMRDEAVAERVLGALDMLLDENERATAAAVIWRILASFELAKAEERARLVQMLPELEKRVWRTRLVESYKAMEDTLARELRREEDAANLDALSDAAASAMHAFLRAGQYERIERIGRILARLGTDQVSEIDDFGCGTSSDAGLKALETLGRTDFYDFLLSDLAAESAERSNGALAALRYIAPAVQDRLIDVLRNAADYRLRRLAADALVECGESGGVAVIAQLGPTTPEEEYERIISVVDALALDPEIAGEEVAQAINHASERVRLAAVSVAYRLPESSALGLLQSAINAGGSLSALRTLQAIGELRLVGALPIVQKQLMDASDPSVIEAGCRAIGRMASEVEMPELRGVSLIEGALEKLSRVADKEEADRAALTALWALGQYRIPEARSAIMKAKSFESAKVAAFAAGMLNRAAQEEKVS